MEFRCEKIVRKRIKRCEIVIYPGVMRTNPSTSRRPSAKSSSLSNLLMKTGYTFVSRMGKILIMNTLSREKRSTPTTKLQMVRNSQLITFSHQKSINTFFLGKIKELMSCVVKSVKILKTLKEKRLVPQSLMPNQLNQRMYRERLEAKTVQRPGNVFALFFLAI